MNGRLLSFFLAWMACWMAAERRVAAGIRLQNQLCSVGCEPASLMIQMAAPYGPDIIVSAAQTNLGTVAGLSTNATRASWTYPDKNVSILLLLDDSRLLVRVLAVNPGKFTFPVMPETRATRAWILPLFEGVYAPCDDKKWRSFLTHDGPFNTTADLTMPFAGLDYGNFTLAYIFTNAFNNQLQFQTADGAMQAGLTHEFTRNHPVKEYGVVIQIGRESPVEPAALYRKWIQERGDFVSLKEKIRQTPEAAKLPGAAHIYLWGDGLLHYSNVKNWRKFAQELRAGDTETSNPPAHRVWSQLTPQTRAFVNQLLNEEWPEKYIESEITGDLNRLLLRSNLSGQNLTPTENCRWLAAAFPGIFESPENWGNGVSPKMIHELAAAGLDRLWLGSGSWDGFTNHPETVAVAKRAGYLIGPYDSYDSIHRPDDPDTWETAQFDWALYKTGAIVNADGSKKHGFKQKGYRLSPDAARPYVERRVTRLMDLFHANSWFVDCDGFGDYFDDYSPAHPATQQSDMASRISRMKWMRDTFGLVIGTEGCSAGVASTVHFAHGVMTPVIGWGDPDLTDKKSKYYLGAYYPPDAPKVFFMPVPVKEEYRHIYFDPSYRLPLFEIVFHDSVIATHHWSWGSLKTRDEAKTVELLELLYNVPPLYHLNLEEFQKRKDQIVRHYQFFSPLHRQLAGLPMTDFRWLTYDHSEQMTTFGDKIDLVANFGPDIMQWEGTRLPAQSILARWRDSGRTTIFTP